MEVLIVLAILGIIAAAAYPVIRRATDKNYDETVCKAGYKFVSRDRRSPQILDSKGQGIPCNQN